MGGRGGRARRLMWRVVTLAGRKANEAADCQDEIRDLTPLEKDSTTSQGGKKESLWCLVAWSIEWPAVSREMAGATVSLDLATGAGGETAAKRRLVD